MTDIDRGTIADEDRLPWLEAVDDEDEGDGVSAGKLVLAVIIALAAIGLVIGGIFWLRERPASGPQGEGGVIAAPKGDYKVAPTGETANGMAIDGEGDATFTASEGGDPATAIDTTSQPEAPLAGSVTSVDAAAVRTKALPPSTAAGPKAPAAPAPAAQPKAPAVAAAQPKAPPAPAASPPPVAGSARIQIGAFSTEALANAGWSKRVSEYPGLSGLSHSVQQGRKANGDTIYRLVASGPPDRVSSVCRTMGPSCIRQ